MIDLIQQPLLLDAAAVVAEASVLGYILTALVTAGVLIACAYAFPGVHISGFVSALILAVIVGAIVAVAGIILPSGEGGGLSAIISLLVGAGALILADKVMDTVRLDSFVWALAVAAILALVNYFLVPTFGTL